MKYERFKWSKLTIRLRTYFFCVGLNHPRLVSVCLWFLPDIVMFLTSIIAFIVLRKLTIAESNDDAEEADQPPANSDSISTEAITYSAEHYVLLKRIGNKPRSSSKSL